MSSSSARLEELLGGRALPSKLARILQQKLDENSDWFVAALESDTVKIKDVLRPIVEELDKTWEACFEGCSLHQAKSLSAADRASVNDLPAINLTYGEVRFDSLALAIASHVDMKNKHVFYDVGSGSGRGCFAAALMHDFTKIRGVEIVPGLHTAAKTQLALYEEKILPRLQAEAAAKGTPLAPQDLEFMMADFRSFDWSDADVVWANSTCFGQELMRHLSNYSERMKEGSYFLTLTQRLTSDHWQLVTPGELWPMSWGSATIYIWKKIKGPSTENSSS